MYVYVCACVKYNTSPASPPCYSSRVATPTAQTPLDPERNSKTLNPQRKRKRKIKEARNGPKAQALLQKRRYRALVEACPGSFLDLEKGTVLFQPCFFSAFCFLDPGLVGELVFSWRVRAFQVPSLEYLHQRPGSKEVKALGWHPLVSGRTLGPKL